MQPELINKVGKDSRSQLVKAKMLEQLLVEYQIETPNSSLATLESNLSYNTSQNIWELPSEFDKNQSFLSIKNQTYSFGDFLEYLNKNQKSINKKWSTTIVVNKQFASFLEKSVFTYKEENLENENEEFAHILNEYREGLLLFELMQDKIWEGAKNDSIGLQEFYNSNKQNYIWPDRIEGSVARSADAKYIKKVRKYWSKNQSNKVIDEALNEEQQNVMFSNGEFELEHPKLPKRIQFKTGISKVNRGKLKFLCGQCNCFKAIGSKNF